MVTSVATAVPFLLKGLGSLLRGRLSVEVLDAAAITVSLLMRDFRTVSVLTLLLGLGEALEYWTRRRSLDSLTESLALNVDSAWLLGEDGTEVSVPSGPGPRGRSGGGARRRLHPSGRHCGGRLRAGQSILHDRRTAGRARAARARRSLPEPWWRKVVW